MIARSLERTSVGDNVIVGERCVAVDNDCEDSVAGLVKVQLCEMQRKGVRLPCHLRRDECFL